MNKLNEQLMKLSDLDITSIAKASINILYKKNKNLILKFDNVIELNNGLNDTDKREMLEGMYQALLDYSKKNNSTVNATIKKETEFVAEAVSDYKNSNKSIIWKIGYAIIQNEISNKSTKRLRLYMSMYMSSKDSRKNNNNWQFSQEEKLFFDHFEKITQKAADTIEKNNNDINLNNTNTSKDSKEHASAQQNKNEEKIEEQLIVDLSCPTNYAEFFWPWHITNNPSNIKELLSFIGNCGYPDDDLEMKNHAVFTTDGRYAIGLAINGNEGYIYVLNKQGHYWEPLYMPTSNGDRIVLVQYNFVRTFNDNIRLALKLCPENMFPIRIKNNSKQ